VPCDYDGTCMACLPISDFAPRGDGAQATFREAFECTCSNAASGMDGGGPQWMCTNAGYPCADAAP
jgi:hypothetical protein